MGSSLIFSETSLISLTSDVVVFYVRITEFIGLGFRLFGSHIKPLLFYFFSTINENVGNCRNNGDDRHRCKSFRGNYAISSFSLRFFGSFFVFLCLLLLLFKKG